MYREDILAHAYALVKSNHGAPGVDGQNFWGIESLGLGEWLNGITKDLRAKTYQPQAVRRVMIPKPGGGERPLGIPLYGTGWCRQPPSCCWNQSLRRTSIQMPMVTGRSGARKTLSRKCTSYFVTATPMWWTLICRSTLIPFHTPNCLSVRLGG